jgi:malonyl-CoA O-methyltransferase
MVLGAAPVTINLSDQARFRARPRADFAAADFLYREVIDRLMARLSIMNHQTGQVLEMDQRCEQLQQDFQLQSPGSQWHSLSIQECYALSQPCADLILSNLSLSVVANWQQFLPGVLSALKDQGLFAFCVLGPDSLREVRDSFEDSAPHVLEFIDMHHIGDALLQVGFDSPVMETQRLTLQYASVDALIRDLRNLGAQNALLDRSRACLPKSTWQAFLANFSALKIADYYPVTIELIFGHAWKSSQQKTAAADEHSVPIEDIIRKQS